MLIFLTFMIYRVFFIKKKLRRLFIIIPVNYRNWLIVLFRFKKKNNMFGFFFRICYFSTCICQITHLTWLVCLNSLIGISEKFFFFFLFRLKYYKIKNKSPTWILHCVSHLFVFSASSDLTPISLRFILLWLPLLLLLLLLSKLVLVNWSLFSLLPSNLSSFSYWIFVVISPILL